MVGEQVTVPERPHPTHSTLRATRPAAAGLLALAGLALVARAVARRVQVEGTSMHPTLQPGDRLLVVRTARVRPGQLVAVRDPRTGRLIVKRVQGSTGQGSFDVRGDNEIASTDSRHFGPVRREQVLGRALYRYAPRERSGRLP